MSNRKTSSSAALTLPPTPVDISLFEEGGVIAMRTAEGLAVYRYDRDVDGKSNCIDACSREWPPVLASGGARRVGDWITIKRSDDTLQWTYRGKPVYTFAHDLPGRTEGDGVGGVWHLLTP
jgi:predicted lipoprotein with Yx(FWY)xxD motif